VRLRRGRPQDAAAFGQFDADAPLVLVIGALLDEAALLQPPQQSRERTAAEDDLVDEVAVADRRVRRDVDEDIELGGSESVFAPQSGSDRVDEVSVHEQHAPPHGDRFGFELLHPSLASSSALRGKYHPMIERRRSASGRAQLRMSSPANEIAVTGDAPAATIRCSADSWRSEEHTSELQSRF